MSGSPFPTLRQLPALTLRPMTRCECAGIEFEDVLAEVRATGATPEEVCVRTGCGQTCGACRPDFESYLRARLHVVAKPG